MIEPLLVSTYDPKGGAGAARAAYRLHQGLIRSGINSQMLVQDKRIDDPTIIAPPKITEKISKLRPNLDDLPVKFYRNRQRKPTFFFSPQWLPSLVTSQIAALNPDTINLHWICGGFIPIEALAKLQKPIVWTFHDQWAFTGGCYYSEGCDGYTKYCGNCPLLGSASSRDLSRWVWQRKASAWQNLNFTIVTPSNWLAECAKSSSLFRDRDIQVIANGLDLNIYKPTSPQTARNLLTLPQDKQLILFGAINSTSNQRKGFHLLQPALQKLSQSGWKDKIELIVFGASQPENPVDLGFPVRYLGKIYDENKLALLYSAADVMLVPSVEEVFGQTASESLACGTPVVSFDSTGLKDIVEHQKNGYRAECFSSDDLAHGIAWVIEDRERYLKLAARAREKAVQEFSLELQASRYLSLFYHVLSGRGF